MRVCILSLLLLSLSFSVKAQDRFFGGSGVGGNGGTVTAMPYIITTDPTTTTSSATTTKFFGSVGPQVNNGYDLGFPNGSWRNLYVSGTARLGTLVVGSGGCVGCGGGMSSSSHLIPSANDTFDIGSPTSSWRSLYVSSTSFFGSSVRALTVEPLQYDEFDTPYLDLGSASRSWNNIYASGTIFASQMILPVYQFSQSVGTRMEMVDATTGAIDFQIDGLLGTDAAYFFNQNEFIATPDNTINLGTAVTSWNDIYASGTLRASSTLLGNGTQTAPTYAFASNPSTGMYTDGNSLKFTFNGGGGLWLDGSRVEFSYPPAPNQNNSLDIGQVGRAWKDIYASGTLRLGTGTSIDGSSLTLNAASGFSNGRFNVDSSGNTSASGSLRIFGNVTSTGHIYPSSNNAVDFGAYGTAFRHTFTSGTLYASGTVMTGMTAIGDAVGLGTGGDFSNNGERWIHAFGSNVTQTSSDNKIIGLLTAYSILPSTDASTTQYNGTEAEVRINSLNTSDIGGIFGGQFTASMQGSGSVLDGMGGLTAGTNHSGTGLVSVMFAAHLERSVNSVFGMVSTTAGLSVSTVSNSGLITDNYGIFIENQSGIGVGTNYSIYSEGGDVLFENGNLFTNHVYATSNNTYDLGRFGNAWKDIYASGTLRVASSTILSTVTTSTVRVGSNGMSGCLAIADTDKSGVTYCYTNNGVMTCSTTSCE